VNQDNYLIEFSNKQSFTITIQAFFIIVFDALLIIAKRKYKKIDIFSLDYIQMPA